MTAQEIDDYLAGAPQPHRDTLMAVRRTIESLLPEADQVISYGVPTYKVGGKGVAGFGYFTNHCAYMPMSGTITTELAPELAGYTTSKGSVKFPSDTPLPEELIRKLVAARLAEISRTGKARK